jgi:hypothetical protein
MQTQPIKTIELSMENGVMTEREVQPKPTTSKTYGRGKLRVNLNSPRGNIYAVWGLALNLMKQCHYTEEETSKNLAELKKDTYEECLQAFGKHKIFGNLFKLYSSPKYMTQYDEGEWGNPDEQTTECEACGDEIEGNDEDENDGLCYLCREA